VQVLADATGDAVHLFERDCSVQRRHQKVVELAPAPGLQADTRDALCAAAVDFARSVDYVNAGTVEFLVDADGAFTFMEMNPRIQVEHTVTEEVTGVDIVASQLLIAGGKTLHDLGLVQDRITVRGVAVQCRITTEDPADDFRPDTGTITSYQSPGGPGVRLDGAVYAGAQITPYFDSLLVKLTTRGPTWSPRRCGPACAARVPRARRQDQRRLPAAAAGRPGLPRGGVTTSFLADRPQLTSAPITTDRTTRMLNALGESTVNGLARPARPLADPASRLPALPEPATTGSRDQLDALGPAGWAAALRAQTPVAVTDTTLRDAHQSLLATRMRTRDVVTAAPAMARLLPGLLSLECWGGATYDVALRFLHEDPWDRLARLREAAPHLCLQMLLRGRNAVGYTPYPVEVVQAFVAEAAETGVDVFRVFDALNDLEQMRPALQAVQDAGKVAEGTLCYTGDLLDPAERLYTLDYYLRLAEGWSRPARTCWPSRTWPACCAPPPPTGWCGRCASASTRPCTCTPTTRPAVSSPRCSPRCTPGSTPWTAQPRRSPAAPASPTSVRWSPPPTTPSGPPVWTSPRCPRWSRSGRRCATSTRRSRPACAPPPDRLPARDPGGQLTNLRQQAISLGLGDRWPQVQELYAVANDLLGKPIKVTPTSKVVGDLALFLAGSDVDVEALRKDPRGYDLPDSVLGYLGGELGTPPPASPSRSQPRRRRPRPRRR
jgi:pyruvate carboxylase